MTRDASRRSADRPVGSAGRWRVRGATGVLLSSLLVAAIVSISGAVAGAAQSAPVTYSATITVPAPPASNFAGSSGGGDGWGVGLTSTQLFNVFHHSSITQVNCHNQSDAT